MGIGNENHALSFATPASLKNRQPFPIRMKSAGTSTHLLLATPHAKEMGVICKTSGRNATRTRVTYMIATVQAYPIRNAGLRQ